MADIRKALKKFLPHLLGAKDAGLNEADTVQRIILFLEEVLGYDPLTEITRESQIRDKYVDVAVKIDGVIRWLIEAKAATVPLRSRHLEQAELYAAEGNYPWVVLTNGVGWHLYHLTFDDGIEYEKVFEVDLAEADPAQAAERLGLLHRSDIIKGRHEDYLRHRQALSPKSLAKAIFSFDTLRLIRRQLRRREGIVVDVEDLADALKSLFSTDAREQIGVIRIQRQPRRRKKAAGAVDQADNEASAPPPPGPSAPPAPTAS